MARSAASRQTAPGGAAGSGGQPAARDARLGAESRHPVGPAAAGLRVTGLFRLKDPASPYWALDQVPFSGFAASTVSGVGTTVIPGVGAPGSLVTYGPAVVSPAAFRSGVTASQASWFVLPPAPVMARQDIGALAAAPARW